MGEVFGIFLLALLSMVNPTLMAGVTIMMLLPDPRRLIAGFLVGAYLSSIGVGLAIALSLHDSAGVESGKKTLSPVEDLVLGAILLVVGWALASGRASGMREHRRARKEAKHGPAEPKESLPERLLGRGSPRIAFAVGAVLSLPGASVLIALDKIAHLDWPTASTALAVVLFMLIEQLLLEIPLVGFWLAPEATERAIVRFRTWVSANALRIGARLALVLGVLLIIRGAIFLIAH
jgi:hypothetical protein